jgi:hypothetical protein
MAEETNADERKIEVTEPIILNMGKQKRKRIRNLMKGKGRLWDEVEGVIDEVSIMLEDELDGKTIVPLIMVYRRKPKRKQGRGLFGL